MGIFRAHTGAIGCIVLNRYIRTLYTIDAHSYLHRRIKPKPYQSIRLLLQEELQLLQLVKVFHLTALFIHFPRPQLPLLSLATLRRVAMPHFTGDEMKCTAEDSFWYISHLFSGILCGAGTER